MGGEVGACLVAAHGACGDVVGAGGLLRGVEGAEPPPLLRHRVADLGGEPAPRPAAHAAVPRRGRALGGERGVEIRRVVLDGRGRRGALAPVEEVVVVVVSEGVEVRVGRSVLHGWRRWSVVHLCEGRRRDGRSRWLW